MLHKARMINTSSEKSFPSGTTYATMLFEEDNLCFLVVINGVVPMFSPSFGE